MPVDDEVPVFRAPMRSRDDSVPEGAGVERGLQKALCGIGGRLPRVPSSLDEAVGLLADEYDERMARRLERFASVPDGAYVWTRDVDGAYWLGRLDGAWRYDASEDAWAADLVHVRPCRWREEPVAEARVPAAVRATFARGGRNWQRIQSAQAFAATKGLWSSED
ncbi:GAF domain-containing protein [Sediminivirga luteola]|jgi:hypothetical protein|uniref:GAF domain-containing protein n=1 Tax=Sediminivirga luteola TaxID=1774748 RepID=A0A8J2XK54_9MICO|nr:GAF domain-containing protein [Sediminivirga luteola]GGA06985.1 hypothetical protein GCM10011333_07050 [Sediminivirga luteola]